MQRFRAHFGPKSITQSGSSIPAATAAFLLLQPGTSTPVTDKVYTTGSGGGFRANPWTPGDGVVDFYLNIPQRVDLQVTIPGDPPVVKTFYNLDVGPVDIGQPTLWRYGAKIDGVTDDTDAVNAAWADLGPRETLYHPSTGSACIITGTLQLPTAQSVTLEAPKSGQMSRPPFWFQAAAPMAAMAATREYLSDGFSPKDPKNLVIRGIGFWGGGSDEGDSHTTGPESTSYATDGLIINGNSFTLDDVVVISANQDGIRVPLYGIGGSLVSESHEWRVTGGTARFCGRDGFHAEGNQQDSWMHMFRPSVAGRHPINFESGGGCSLVQCHPTFGGADLIHKEGGWPIVLVANYLTTVGEYLDNTGYVGTHYAISIVGPGIVNSNEVHINPEFAQHDPTAGFYFEDGPISYMGNWLSTSPIANAHEKDTVSLGGTDSIIGPNLIEIG